MSRKGDPDYRPKHAKRKYNPENRKPSSRDTESRPDTPMSESDDFFYGYSPIGERKNKYAAEVGESHREPEAREENTAPAAAGQADVDSIVEEIVSGGRDEDPGDNFDVDKPEQGVIKARDAFKVARTVADVSADEESLDEAQPAAVPAQADNAVEPAAEPEKAEEAAADEPAQAAEEPDEGTQAVDEADAAEETAEEESSLPEEEAPEEPVAFSAPVRVTNVDLDSANVSSVRVQDDWADYSEDHHKSKRKKRVGKRIAISILCVILALIIGIVGTFFVMKEMGRRSLHNNEGMEVVMPTADSAGAEIISADKFGRIITYNGVSYTFNDNIIALTMIGVDNGTGDESHLNMADAIYILTIDAKTGATKILGVSRDTMTDVDVYSAEGSYIEAEKLQIAYSYAYHGVTTTSGDNTNKSVSRLFFGLPCKNYFAINLEALTTLNDAIGGVTLTSMLTFKSPEDGRIINEGDEVTLHGKEAEIYVRRRDISQLDSNNTRMMRQQQYIKAFLKSAFEAAKKDISVISELYSAISSNSDSSLDLTQLTYIASTALTKLGSTDDIEYINLKGKLVAGDHAEMYVSNDEVLRTMLDVFYTPMNNDKAAPTAADGAAPTTAENAAPTAAVNAAPDAAGNAAPAAAAAATE